MAVQGPETAWVRVNRTDEDCEEHELIFLQPAPLRINKRPSEPFDSSLLIAKLEAHLLEQDRQRAARQVRDAAANRAVFVPRTAAKQFASTTTPMVHGQTDPQRRRDSANSPRRTSEPAIDVEALNPKAVQAARSVGMSDAEILTQNTCEVRRSTSNGAYRPGDANKRNEKRRTLPAIPQGTINANMFPHDYDMSADHRPEPADVFESMTTAPDDGAETRASLSGQRPALRAHHDRANWAQESECGEGARHLLRWRARKASGDKEAQQQGSRRKSSSPGQENLVSEAVKQIKVERSNRRKSKVIGFFKRTSS